MHSISLLARRTIGCALILALTGCVNIAKLENFPSSASQIPFDDVAARATRVDGFWNLQTDYEYYFEVTEAAFEQLHAGIEAAVKEAGYEVMKSDKVQSIVLGQRGIRMNEWSSVVGVYYRRKNASVQIYIKNEITQDITGGWRSNRAKEVGELLCKRVQGCRSSA